MTSHNPASLRVLWLSCSLTMVFLISFFTPSTAHASEPHPLAGSWRGVLDIQEHVQLVLGVNVVAVTSTDGADTDYQVTLDSPTQGMFEHAVTETTLNDDRITLQAAGLGATLDVQRDGNALVGTFTQAAELPIRLHRLEPADLQRLTFEGQYQGQLQISSSQTLPLQLNVAVLHQGEHSQPWLATLDSPAQQSFGLPIDDIQLDQQQLRFSASLLGASYTATRVESDDSMVYEGTFVQGLPMPLTLTKVAHGERMQVDLPELGAKGGAKSVITLDPEADNGFQRDIRFYQEHDHDTLFEIGSVTKTMVAYLLADAYQRDAVATSAQVKDFFSDAPDEISLSSLATHTSGLPRLPPDLFADANPHDPYAHYSIEHLRTVLGSDALQSTLKPKSDQPDYEYSNFAFGILAESLAIAESTDLSSLINQRLWQPASMPATYLALEQSSAKKPIAQGHNALGDEVAHWHFDALAGAGAVVSNIDDMSNYVEFMLQGVRNQDPAILRMLEPQHQMAACCAQALGWMLRDDEDGNTIAWHGGQTAGFTAFAGFYLDGSAGLVLLNNQAYDHSAALFNELHRARAQVTQSATAE